ncbi:MAG: cryptochrome/photolyase family protein, partial [Alphaproteobacteria bacterium]|nr:cryptochrome/photolyase family protein [Alphaproteobacteria bacterium]
DYCKKCRFDPDIKAGPKACPFNYLYWDFMIRNRDVLGGNPRLGYTYKNLARMDDARISEIKSDAAAFFVANGMEEL